MASVYARPCTLCQKFTRNRKVFLSHLLRPKHQKLARKECSSWRSNAKKRVLVIYSRLPFATKKGLFAFTDAVGRRKIVADLVWSPNRPRVGIVLFEKKISVTKIINRYGENELGLGEGQRLQFKRASDLLDLEWGILLEEVQGAESEEESLVADEKISYEDDGDDDIIEIEEVVKVVCEDDDDVIIIDELVCESPPSRRSLIPINCSPPSVSSLIYGDYGCDPSSIFEEGPWEYRRQYEEILQEISIPDEDFKLALDVMQRCEIILSSQFPAVKLYMFRHWYLKLRNNGTNELLFYVDFEGALDGSKDEEMQYYNVNPYRLERDQIQKLFHSKLAQDTLPGVDSVRNPMKDREMRAVQFIHQPSGLVFGIVGDSEFRTEAQTCRLVNFLLDCDPRARPFLTMIFYWAKKWEISTSGPVFKSRQEAHVLDPKPASLEWLILLFLIEKSIIPSPRKVQRRVHKKLMVFKTTDIGFSTKEWKHPASENGYKIPPPTSNEFFILLVELARDFLNFFIELRSGSWVLNTRDGELIRKQVLLKNIPYKERETLLRKEEIGKIRKCRKHWEKLRVVMLHPLVCEWRIVLSQDVFREGMDFKMSCSVAIINEALKCEAEGPGEEFNLVNMFQPETIKTATNIVNRLPFAPENVLSNVEKPVANLIRKPKVKNKKKKKSMVVHKVGLVGKNWKKGKTQKKAKAKAKKPITKL